MVGIEDFDYDFEFDFNDEEFEKFLDRGEFDDYTLPNLAEAHQAFKKLDLNEQYMKREQAMYTVLEFHDIKKCIRAEVEVVRKKFGVKHRESVRLLCYFNWNVLDISQWWYDDQIRVRQQVGLQNPNITAPCSHCWLCSANFTYGRMALTCGHSACPNCWRSFVNSAVSAGSESLMLTCPVATCNHGVLVNTIMKYSSPANRLKFDSYLVNSYVDGHKLTKKCPGQNCIYAIQLSESETLNSGYVTCLCLQSWCWNCQREAHDPVKCETVTKWFSETSDESEKEKTPYYELIATADLARNKAIQCLTDLKQIQIVQFEKRYKMFEFVIEAWEQVIECRRVLKWSYAHGYYLDEAEKTPFEILRNQAGKGLDAFQNYIEEETLSYSFKDFSDLRQTFISQTALLREIFDKLVSVIDRWYDDAKNSKEFHC